MSIDLADVEPNDYQCEMIAKVLGGVLPLASRAGIGVGKTFGIALLLLILSRVVPGARVLVVMKSIKIVKRVLMPACRALFGTAARWSEGDSLWRFRNGFQAEFALYRLPEGADEAQNPIEGADVWLVIIDEAQMLPEIAFKHAVSRARMRVRDITGQIRRAGVLVQGRPAAREWHRRKVSEMVEKVGGNPADHVLNAGTMVNAANLDPDYIENQRAVWTPAQFKAIVEGGEMPPEEGQAFGGEFKVAAWPDGNIYEPFLFDPSRPTRLAIDLGQNRPHGLLIQEVVEHVGGRRVVLDVVFAELAPTRILTPALVMMLTMGWKHGGRTWKLWPRGRRGMPDGAIPLDRAIVDPAGCQSDRHSGLSDIDLLRRPPTEEWMPGLGVAVSAPGGLERKARNRAQRIQQLLLDAAGVRRLVLAPSMLLDNLGGRALYTALNAYTFDDILRAETRSKGGLDLVSHAIDALGYYAVEQRRVGDGAGLSADDLMGGDEEDDEVIGGLAW